MFLHRDTSKRPALDTPLGEPSGLSARDRDKLLGSQGEDNPSGEQNRSLKGTLGRNAGRGQVASLCYHPWGAYDLVKVCLNKSRPLVQKARKPATI